jgi:hypothetical protein
MNMNIDEKISQINTAIEYQISRLEIKLPQDVALLWKTDIQGACWLRPQMDSGRDALINKSKQWIVADDTKDFQMAHLVDEKSSASFNFSTQTSNSASFPKPMKLLILSRKENCFAPVMCALKSVGGVEINEISENYREVIEEYFAKNKNWGVNPDYYGHIIRYRITLPVFEYDTKKIN